MKKIYYLVILFCLSVQFANAQCVVTPKIDLHYGLTSSQTTLSANTSVFSQNTAAYDWHWKVNNDSTSAGFNTNTISNYILESGLNKICLTIDARDSITGDLCTGSYCNIFAGADWRDNRIVINVIDDPLDSLTEHFEVYAIQPGGTPTINFGDGNSVSGWSATHTYATAGTYTIGGGSFMGGTIKVGLGVNNFRASQVPFTPGVYSNYCDSVYVPLDQFSNGGYFFTYDMMPHSLNPLTSKIALEMPGNYFMVTRTSLNGFYGDVENFTSIAVNDCGTPPDTIHGIVWDDKNLDGIKDTSEHGIPNMEVGLSIANYNPRTDSSGYYEMLVPRHYFDLELQHNVYALTYPQSSRFEIKGSSASSTYNFGLALLSSHINGSVFADLDSNNIFSSGDFYIKTASIKATDSSSGKSFYSSVDNHGDYSLFLPNGIYYVKPAVTLLSNPISTPDSIRVVANNGFYVNNDFAIRSHIAQPDFELKLYCSDNPRPGFAYTVKASILNRGFRAAAGTLIFHYDPSLNFDSADVQGINVNQVSSTITMSIASLNPTIWKDLNIFFHLPASVPLGTVLNCNGTTNVNIITDYDLTNNSAALSSTVVGSFDPNDKIVSPEGFGAAAEIHHDQRLHYRINFQNTGTASAINVIVRDTISDNLDMNTFLMERASHNYEFRADGNILTWKFFNINLPDSNTNEKLSHGFIEYSINPKTGLNNGETIQNTAAIYFDFNEPVLTNTTFNTLQTSFTSVEELDDQNRILVYPVPVKDELTIIPSGFNQSILKITLTDIAGKEVAILFNGNYSENKKITYNTKQLTKGMYFLRCESANEQIIKKIIK